MERGKSLEGSLLFLFLTVKTLRKLSVAECRIADIRVKLLCSSVELWSEQHVVVTVEAHRSAH